MPDSPTAKLDPHTPDTTIDSANMSTTPDLRVLRIDTKGEVDKVARKLIPLHGQSPQESISWRSFANTYLDSRTRGGLTLQYKAKQEDDELLASRSAQDCVMRGLWSRLGDILLDDVVDDLPNIAFGESSTTSTQPSTVISLTFPSDSAFIRVRETLKQIDLGSEGNRKRLFTLRGFQSHLPGDIFLFDCLDLPIEGLDGGVLFSSLAAMTQQLGSLLGISKVVLKDEVTKMQAELGTVRAYLKLARPWLTVPLRELASRMPSHLLWHGVPYKLLYNGDDLDSKRRYSADYPIVAPSGGELQSSENGGTQEDASTSTSKKRKAVEE